MYLIVLVLTQTLTGTKEIQTLKISPAHYSPSTKLYCWHYVLRQLVLSRYLPNPDASIRLIQWRVIHQSRELGFTVLESSRGQALKHVSWNFTLPIDVRQLLGYGNPFQESPRGAWKFCSEWCKGGNVPLWVWWSTASWLSSCSS